MPIDDTALAAALDAGIKDASASPSPTPAETPDGSDAQETVSGATGTDDHGGDEGEGAAPEGAAEGAAEGEQAPADPLDVDPAKTAADAAAAAAKKPAVTVAPVKPPDELNDPLPNALKKETKDRIHKLISRTKTAESERETIKAERDEVMGFIEQSTATPEQYGQALDYIRKVNSNNRAEQEEALQFMMNEVSVLAKMLGKPVAGVNMLEGHDDLINEVGSGRLSMERANEIAAARHAQQIATVRSQQAQQTQRQTQAQQAAVTAARADLNALEVQLRGSDPNYNAKRAVLLNQLKPIFRRLPPAEWKEAFLQAYNALPAPPTARPPNPGNSAAATGGGAGNTPLRAMNPAGGAVQAPKSPLDAVNQALQFAR